MKKYEKHGLTGTKVQQAWIDIRKRCSKPTSYKDEKYYKAKGITVCRRWDSLLSFVEDMGLPPTKKHQIDRIDSSKGYYPENCRWVLPRVNVLNRDVTRWITFKGETKCMGDWAKSLGVPASKLHYRLKAKWPLEKVLSTTNYYRRK